MELVPEKPKEYLGKLIQFGNKALISQMKPTSEFFISKVPIPKGIKKALCYIEEPISHNAMYGQIKFFYNKKHDYLEFLDSRHIKLSDIFATFFKE